MPHFMAHFGNYSRHGHKKIESQKPEAEFQSVGATLQVAVERKIPLQTGCKTT